MLETNTMQRGTDEFKFRRQALIRTTEPLDFTRETQVAGFNVYGTEPEGSARRIIFEVDDKLYYFTNDGITAYPSYGELADILKYGNTVEELLAVNGVAKWIGKKVYPIIALDAPFDAQVMPKIKIAVNVECFLDEYTRDEYSPILELKHTENQARIVKASYVRGNNGYAKSNIWVRLRDNTGYWTDWLEMADAYGKEATAAQFKITYILSTLDGSDESRVFECKIEYTTDGKTLAGDTLELCTLPQTYYHDLGTCYAMIKHSELLDAEIKAYIKYSTATKNRRDIVIGTGTGDTETYYLGINGGIDRNINHNTLRLKAGVMNIPDFYYDTTWATVTLKAPVGAEIKASYEYDLNAEEWVEMAGELTQLYDDGIYMSRFIHRLTDFENKTVSAVKFTLTRKNGAIPYQYLGTADGTTMKFVLPHRAKKESISCTGNWDYDEDTQVLTVTGLADEEITIAYDWVGLIPKIENIAVGWTAAT